MSPRRLLAVLGAFALALPAPSAVHAQEPSPGGDCVEGSPDGYERIVDLTFPVRGDVTYGDHYDHGRAGHTHQATDIMAGKLQTVHAALGGVVQVATGIDEPMPSYGYYLKIRHDDGTSAAYVHLNNDMPGTDDGAGGPAWAYAPGIREGVRVERGQWIGYVGDSGNAEGTGAHLHFELEDPELDDPCLAHPMYDPKTRLNPYPSLVDAERRGDYPPPPESTSGEESDAEIVRLGGTNRVLTAVAISQRREPEARAVIVVPEGSHAEALTAAPLAGLLDAPVLLSGVAGLHADAVAEVERLAPRNAYVIGREDQLADEVEDQLRDAGVKNLARIAEDDPFALSARIAEEIASYQDEPGLERVLLALGEHDDPKRSWPDALSAGALAAVTKAPVLLTRGDELPDAVRELLEELEPSLVQVVGGTAAVSEATADEAADAADGRVQRLAGANRFATSVVVAEEAVRMGLSAPAVWLATGHDFPDALAAGPAAAREGAPLLLVDGREPQGAREPEEWLADRAGEVTAAVVVGGTAVITEAVRTHLEELIGS